MVTENYCIKVICWKVINVLYSKELSSTIQVNLINKKTTSKKHNIQRKKGMNVREGCNMCQNHM